MDKNKAKWEALSTKKERIRKHVGGTPQRPRLSIYRSEQHIYGQIIDDIKGHTLVAVSTVSADVRERVKDLKPIEAAKVVGEALAEKAVAAGVTKVVFDRNGRQYGGRLQALADAARAKGLQF
jgi:large subunit ribosomal protein L18